MKMWMVIFINYLQNLTAHIILTYLKIRYSWKIRMNLLSALCRGKRIKTLMR
jgi:hypothetical protein